MTFVKYCNNGLRFGAVIAAIGICAPAHAQMDAAAPAVAVPVKSINAAQPTQAPLPAADAAPMPPAPSIPPGVDVLPAKSLSTQQLGKINPDAPTNPPIRLTPDKSEIVRLDAEAGTVIVGNPAHLSVLADNSKTLVLVPKAAGATYFTVLDTHSNVIMQRHVIVAGPEEKYIRIRKSCAGSANQNCQATAVYYCPDMCHEIIMNDAPAAAASPDAGNADATGGGVYTPPPVTPAPAPPVNPAAANVPVAPSN